MFRECRRLEIAGQEFSAASTVSVRLWHPLTRSADEVASWRKRLEACGIRQPLKQAHREVYRLTDAERRTETYSNRFAAHVLRQHQFAALCAARRWYYQLHVAADVDCKPPALTLPTANLRAEFWIEPICEFGEDTNAAGSFLHVTTDQVRFCEADAELPRLEPTADGFRLTPGPSRCRSTACPTVLTRR